MQSVLSPAYKLDRAVSIETTHPLKRAEGGQRGGLYKKYNLG